MAGLLDFVATPEGQGLLSAAFGGLAGARRGQPLNSIGRAGLAGLAGYSQAQDRQTQEAENEVQRKYREMQMQGMQTQIAQQKAQQDWRAGLPKVLEQAQPTYGAGDEGPTMTPGNPQALQSYLMRPESPFADKLLEQRLIPKSPEYKVVGNSLVQVGPGGVQETYRAPEKPEATPSAVREYQTAVSQGYKGSFMDYQTHLKRAGATTVSVGSDNLGLKPKDRFEMEDKLRADYDKATTNDSELVTTASNIANILAQNGALKDQAAIYSFAKALDPMGAVREADYAAIVRTAGGLDYVTALVNKAITGEQLSPKQRLEMKSLTESMAKVASDRIKKQQATFANRAKMYNLKPENVFSPQSESGVVDFGSLK